MKMMMSVSLMLAGLLQLGSALEMNMQVDNQFQVFGDGMLVGTGDEWWTTYTYDFDPSTKVIGIEGENLGGPDGMVFTLSNGIVSDENTKCLGVNSVTDAPSGWATPGFDDSAWESAKVLGDYGMDPWGFSHGLGDDQVNLDASWIWSENPALFVLCRIVLAEPTEVPTAAPTEPSTQPPVTCPSERELFQMYGLPVEPVFTADCRFELKQCNSETCWCVKAKTGQLSFGGVEVPLGEDYDCSKKPKRCQRERFALLLAGQGTVIWTPECTETGIYAAKQCNSDECWCVRTRSGQERKNTRTPAGTDLMC